MLKNRSIQVKLVQDSDKPGPKVETATIDPDHVIETVTLSVCAVIVVYKLATLIGNSAEHVVTTKIK
jgi:hypothetical protein